MRRHRCIPAETALTIFRSRPHEMAPVLNPVGAFLCPQVMNEGRSAPLGQGPVRPWGRLVSNSRLRCRECDGRSKAVVFDQVGGECGDIIGRFNRRMRFASQRRSGEAPSSDAKTLPGGVHSVCQCPNRESDDRDQYRHLPG
jgi:hypothetical protein